MSLFGSGRRVRGNLTALGANVNTVGRMAAGFLNDTVPAPLYRMPLNAFYYALPVLVSENIFTRAELQTLNDFLENAEAFNRGLDQVNTCTDVVLGEAEVRRVAVKAQKLRPRDDGPSLYDIVAHILDSKEEGGFEPVDPELDNAEEKALQRLANIRAKIWPDPPQIPADQFIAALEKEIKAGKAPPMTIFRDVTPGRVRGRKLQTMRAQAFAKNPLCHGPDSQCEGVGRVRQWVVRDHVLPLFKGGKDQADNLQYLCAECDYLKTNKDLGRRSKPKIGPDGYPVK